MQGFFAQLTLSEIKKILRFAQNDSSEAVFPCSLPANPV
jgi:hypothetical protein